MSTVFLGVFSLSVGFIVTVAAVIAMIHFDTNRQAQLAASLVLLLGLYPMGQGFRNLELGSDFARYNLADVGFPVYLMLVLGHTPILILWSLRYAVASSEHMDCARQLTHLRLFAGIGIGLSIIWEILAWGLNQATDKPLPIGTFDMHDMAAYIVGGGIAILALSAMKNTSLEMARIAMELETEVKSNGRRRSKTRR